jgi:hypothetical protein
VTVVTFRCIFVAVAPTGVDARSYVIGQVA